MVVYGFAIFTGAFLLFQVQPLVGKFLLPWFGGSPGVWTTCLLFFQVVLLGGYGYAYLSSRLLKLRAQAVLHLVIVAAAVASLPIIPNPAWKSPALGDPTFRILALLTVSLGLPYFALSATAPLLQHWFSRSHPGKSPFRLYALSNAASLLALLSYPAFFEIQFSRAMQAALWGAGLVLYGIACAWCGWQVWRAADLRLSEGTALSGAVIPPTWGQRALWLSLPACASVLLLAITNKICQDVAVVAFLWVLPLAVYLLSFIICFEKPRWYARAPLGIALLAALAGMAWILTGRFTGSVPVQILIYLSGLFICCLVCHGEVYRLKPDPAHLTSFYLWIAAGGALGGIFVAVIAPAIFADYFELQWGLVGCGLFFLVALGKDQRARPTGPATTLAYAACWLVLAMLTAVLWGDARKHSAVRAYRSRNFYGVLNVYRYQYADPTLSQVELMHGRMSHGMQFLHPSRAGWPTLYYSRRSGIGRVMDNLGQGNRRIGVVGLGAGTLAAYARPGDQIRFYEINPEVQQVATTLFSFLTNSTAAITVVLGDARLSMQSEPPQDFDLLVLDAFNSDSIPVHLLTKEAFEIYQRHLKAGGVIAVHVSNASLDLSPIVLGLAQEFGYPTRVIESPGGGDEWWDLPSTWVVLSRDLGFLEAPTLREATKPGAAAAAKMALWTDDFSSLFSLVRWREAFQPAARRSVQYVQVAAILERKEDVALAISRFRDALKTDPTSSTAMNNLACLLATASDPALRNGTQAVALAEQACKATGYANAVMLTTLAAAYAETGRFEEAVATAEQACELAARNGEQPLLKRNRQLLEFYRQRQPYHQSPPVVK